MLHLKPPILINQLSCYLITLGCTPAYSIVLNKFIVQNDRNIWTNLNRVQQSPWYYIQLHLFV